MMAHFYLAFPRLRRRRAIFVAAGMLFQTMALVLLVLLGADGVAADTPPAAERLSLTTSDGVSLAAWYYPVAGETVPRATVIVVHDLGGSHETIEPFSRGLQAAGYAVVAPDLRGHGGSVASTGAANRAGGLDANSLRRPDMLAIAASAGGRIRDQAQARGDLETVYRWVEEQAETGTLKSDRLCIVGCGEGGTLATLWTVADASWPPTTRGAQGGRVRAIVLISPAWVAKGGVSILPALKTDVFRRRLPILLLSGSHDTDAKKLTEQFKALRPKEWMVQGPGQVREQADGLAKSADASIFCMHADSPLSADKLASDATAKAPGIVASFFDLVLDR